MVMHSHMLNPYSFLEDTMRQGLRAFWTSGLPWRLLSSVITKDSRYTVTEETKAHWVARTGCNWDNTEDPSTKQIQCPFCPAQNHVPWTTCGRAEADIYRAPASELQLIGNGYGDGQFFHTCQSCGQHNYKELLPVTRFIHDVDLLLRYSVPMPGTILTPFLGRPQLSDPEPGSQSFSNAFPNRMLTRHEELRNAVCNLLRPLGATANRGRLGMETIKQLIERITTNPAELCKIDGVPFTRNYKTLPRTAQLATRQMMSRYWGNSSIFALDLCGAVMRQGSFIDKMVRLDWLHSPSGQHTASRIIIKYGRFLQIMKRFPRMLAVPTLDVDLAWHTHQLNPGHYYLYTLREVGKFINHDDKVGETKLSEAFARTSRIYQTLFREAYNECTCWYCECKSISNLNRQLLCHQR